MEKMNAVSLFGSDDELTETQQQIEYERVKAMLPHGDLAPLFESEHCLLCKGDKPGKRAFYAITDMGHKEPQGKKNQRIGLSG